MKLVNSGAVALFIKYRLTSSSGKQIEVFDKAHIICWMHKLKSSREDSDDLSISFHRSIEDRQKEVTKNKTEQLQKIFMLDFI